jgi:hypothetical protein
VARRITTEEFEAGAFDSTAMTLDEASRLAREIGSRIRGTDEATEVWSDSPGLGVSCETWRRLWRESS